MLMYFTIFLLTALVAPFLWKTNHRLFKRKEIFLIIFFLASIYAGLRGEDVDYRDYHYYKYAYHDVQSITPDEWLGSTMDPIFIMLSQIYKSGFGDIGFYFLILTFSVLSLLIKFRALLIIRADLSLFIVFWVSSYLYLHEFIQIRAALAISFLMLAAAYKLKGKYINSIFLFIFAVLAHGQAFVGVLIFFVTTKKNIQIYYDFAIILSLLIRLFLPDRVMNLLERASEILTLQDIARSQYLLGGSGDLIFPGIVIIHIVFYLILRILGRHTEDIRFIYFLRIYSLCLILYWLTPFSGVVAYRLLEQFAVFFGISAIFLHIKYANKLAFIVAHSSILFYFYMIEREILSGYSLIIF